ncbi:hypothetical protein EVAR_41117_1 [Eumeta japonica]|uniref:Uncharacterized protein n=1 Tax=Eumeta variegata TaxID=151549 RepID=A0A4C1XBJ9_EUMVA|nr:hypothetical protein EVAR_41117_1 [Eumeta japonica]
MPRVLPPWVYYTVVRVDADRALCRRELLSGLAHQTCTFRPQIRGRPAPFSLSPATTYAEILPLKKKQVVNLSATVDKKRALNSGVESAVKKVFDFHFGNRPIVGIPGRAGATWLRTVTPYAKWIFAAERKWGGAMSELANGDPAREEGVRGAALTETHQSSSARRRGSKSPIRPGPRRPDPAPSPFCLRSVISRSRFLFMFAPFHSPKDMLTRYFLKLQRGGSVYRLAYSNTAFPYFPASRLRCSPARRPDRSLLRVEDREHVSVTLQLMFFRISRFIASETF